MKQKTSKHCYRFWCLSSPRDLKKIFIQVSNMSVFLYLSSCENVLVENLFIHNITCGISWFVINSSDCQFDWGRRAYSRQGHIKLTMGETWITKPHPNIMKSLSLGFVDRHCKSHSYRELSPAPLKGKLPIFGSCCDARNQNLPSVEFSTYNATF